MEHIYGVPALADTDQIGTIGQWSRALARTLAARDAAIVRATGTIPEGDPETVAGILTRLGVVEEQTEDTGWVTVPYLAPHVEQPGYPLRARLIGSVVYLSGGVAGDSLGATGVYRIATLPAEYRPPISIYTPIGANDASATPMAVIEPGGRVQVRTGDTAPSYALFDGLSYPIN